MSTNVSAVIPSRHNLRWWLSGVTFLAYLVAFFDRSNVSIVIVDKAFTDTLGITADKGAQGLLLTVFLVFYGVACFFAGPVVNRFGPRKVLGVSLLLWAAVMAVMGSVSLLAVMLLGRALLGLSESTLGPSVAKLVKTWFPLQERARANGIWYLGITLSSILAMPLIAWWITAIGWRGSFYALALIGVIPAAGALWFVFDLPSKHPKISSDEAAYIVGGAKEDEASAPVSSGSGGFSFVKSGKFWSAVVVYAVVNAGSWGVMGWMPTYFEKTLGFSFTQMGLLSALPYLVGGAAVIVITPLMDKFNRRAVFVMICCLGFGASLFAAMVVANPAMVVAVFCVALLFEMPIAPGLWAIVQNITSPAEVANATGVLNGVGYVGAAVFPYAMGAIYTATGYLAGGFYLLGFVILIGVVAGIPMVRARL